MKRRYTIADYRQAVGMIRDKIPDVAITTDVIVGFPGETGAEFQETLDFCREMEFARVHVFPFSPRPGTAAATLPGQAPDSVKNERRRLMLDLAKETAGNFRRRCLGKTMPVLFEQASAGGWTGLTGNYLKVYAKSSAALANRLLEVKLVKLYRDGVLGEVL